MSHNKQLKLDRLGEIKNATGLSPRETLSYEKKWDFLINTVNNLLSEINSFRDRINRDKKFLYTTLAAFLAFGTAPVGMTTPLGIDVRIAYGVTGAFFAMMLMYFVNRHIKVVGSNLKKNMIAFQQISLIRGMAQREGFFGADDLLLPTALCFTQYTENNPCRLPARDIREYSAVPHFYALLNLFLLAAFFFFTSVVMHSWTQKAVLPLNRSNDLFSIEYLYRACMVLAPLAWLAIHWQRNAYLKFEKRLWEARMVSPKNPNPAFPDPDRRHRKWTVGAAHVSYIILALLWIPNCLYVVDRSFYDQFTSHFPQAELVVGFVPFLVICAVLTVGKIIDVWWRLALARTPEPIRDGVTA